ncbi:chromosome segregation SMC family protein [Oceaniovalibus sp. ACAM 378]|uniref:chromosome segregation SMC family protein n=1 Tax=Oceaniovalibus sp. ACAM 378 TaxID=2599923 RepID=UPI002106AD4C|nr:AAA family ATPase [Oceaniovalibus sp. ACAM 378]
MRLLIPSPSTALRFTRLKLNGFKSFVDPTDLVIAEGLTGVVGPNGCGKSNLLEALRWVMGENRASAMRGGGMEDVIFAGAATRPARNFAEVALHIDNSERRAPAGFNDSDMLEVTRRITRDAGSAYKANARDVRARDVQMLFADASTGAHSPALVRQGQISELINAKPKARRRILEEAAGISGLYQRRHEAELKLKGAETNLLRVDDVVEALAAQLAQLSRQARQAARYREIGAQLRQAEGLLLYRRWREADVARAAALADLRARTSAASEAERAARTAEEARARAEDALPPLREEEAIAAAVLQRLEVEQAQLTEREGQARARVAGLRTRIAQLDQDGSREDALNRDAGESIAALQAESAELAREQDGHDERLSIAEAASDAAGDILTARESALAQLTEDVARLSARHQSAHRLVEDTSRTRDRAEREAALARQSVATTQDALQTAEDALNAAANASTMATDLATAADEALLAADAAQIEAQSLEAEARAERSSAAGELGAIKAEAGALAKLVNRDTAEGGQVMDLLTVTPGYELALGAALADDLRAPAIGPAGASGWAPLPGYGTTQPLPEGIPSLADHVRVPDVLTRRIGQIGIVPREEGTQMQAALHPGQRLVSTEGDLWRWDGFRAGADDAPSAATLRLQQMNRLESLKQEMERALARADGAERAHEMLKQQLDALTRADRDAREARRDADRQLADASRAQSRAEADRTIAAGKQESARQAVARHEEDANTARTRLAEAEATVAELGDLSAARGEIADVRMTVEASRLTMLQRRSAHDELRRDGEARTKRAAAVEKELTGWLARLDTAGKRMADLDQRRAAAAADLDRASGQPAEIAEKRVALSDSLDVAIDRRRTAGDALAAGEAAARSTVQAERDSERAAGEAREARAAAEARAEAATGTVTQAVDRIDEALEITPQQLLDTLGADPDAMPPAEQIEAEVNRLKRQRDSLGAVNLRAEEDAQEVQGEHDLLVREKADLEDAIRALRTGIAALNKEGRERLLTAFEQVNSNFSMLFTHLFNGGEARLELIESDDPLDAGLEIMCQPPGKKLSTLSLLSGGEQTLTAMALIFAVFLANPAPICVLDEVDAPLDDANVTRFCDLLDEMTRQTETRFLIITHHAVTMARMDRLFGVTMGEQGVSQLVSVDLKNAEALVA